MFSNIINFPSASERSGASEILGTWLKAAMKGDVAEVLVIGKMKNGSYYRSCSTLDDLARTIGELEVLKSFLISQHQLEPDHDGAA